MKSHRATVRILPIVCIVAIVYVWGRTALATPANVPTSAAHVLTISDGGDLMTLNPHLAWNAPVANLSELTMAWLVRWDERNQPYPELATAIPTRQNGGISPDGLTLTYHLRKGVVWSDGAPFTADDVVFSTNVVNNPANNEGTRFDQVRRVEAPDQSTVVFHLKKPYSTFVEALFSSCCANPSILPKHLLAKYATINNVPYNSLPVGIGPFKFSRWDRGKQVVLVANPLYWRGRPKLDRIVYKVIPNQDELFAQLAAHKLDLWYQFSGSYYPRVKALDAVVVLRKPSYAYDHLDFNLTRPAMADPQVREALRLALDRHALVDRFANGIGIVQDSATPVSAPYFVDTGTTPYDPVKANAVLDRAGWTRAADGIRAKNGLRLDFDLATAIGGVQARRSLAFVAEQWRRIGVNLRIRQIPANKMFAPPQQGGVLYGRDWDISLFAWGADPYGDFSAEYGCDQFPPQGQNNVRWCDKAAQAAMDALYGHFNQDQRTADVRIVMERFVADVPSIVTKVREDLFAYGAGLKNYNPNSVTIFDNMMNVDK
jgi:peptide/nickel transport system substrate-binding protein